MEERVESMGVSSGGGAAAGGAGAAAGEVDLAALMDLRARTYGMLARLYRKEVDLDVLRELQGMRFPTATGNAKVDEGYHLLYDYLRGAWDDSVTELAIDYVRTFIGHGVNGYSAAYPYESVYTSERRLMMQEARAEVLKTLREGREDEAVRHVRTQRTFAQEHLLNWLPLLTGDMRLFARTMFYQGLAQLTMGYVEEDEAVLTELLDGAPAGDGE